MRPQLREPPLLLPQRLAQHVAPGERLQRDMAHLRGVVQPGDRIVFERGGRAAPDRVCAVRHPSGLRLSRVLASGRSLLLLPGEGQSGFESLELRDDQDVADLVVASHVLIIRL